MADTSSQVKKRPVGLADVRLVFVSPGRLFARVEDVPTWRWPLVVLLALVTLIGYATVETGLIDRDVKARVYSRLAQIDKEQHHTADAAARRDAYERAFRQGEFDRTLARLRAVVAEPVKTLATALFVAAVLYGVVALTGRKPEWNTLLSVCVLAGFVEALRLLVSLGLTLHFRTLEVTTSLAPLAELWPGSAAWSRSTLALLVGAFGAIDPFRIWYWIVVYVGVTRTMQLRGWRAALVCVAGGLVGGAVGALLLYNGAAGTAKQGGA